MYIRYHFMKYQNEIFKSGLNIHMKTWDTDVRAIHLALIIGILWFLHVYCVFVHKMKYFVTSVLASRKDMKMKKPHYLK